MKILIILLLSSTIYASDDPWNQPIKYQRLNSELETIEEKEESTHFQLKYARDFYNCMNTSVRIYFSFDGKWLVYSNEGLHQNVVTPVLHQVNSIKFLKNFLVFYKIKITNLDGICQIDAVPREHSGIFHLNAPIIDKSLLGYPTI